MKKVIGLFLVILISTATVFAQGGDRQGKKGDPSKRSEKMIEELKLDDKQAAEYRKVEADRTSSPLYRWPACRNI